MTSLTALDTSALGRLMRQQAASFDRLARLAAARLTVERVHDLRVLTRRMRSAVAIARQTSDDKAFDLLRKLLRRTGRALGLRRTLDVAAEDYAAMSRGKTTPFVETERIAAGDAVSRRCRPRKRAEIARAVRDAVAALKPGDVTSYLEKLAGRLERALADAKTPETWHALRIQAKKIRYVLEILEVGSADRELRNLQRVLGRAHDFELLADRLDRNDPIRDRARRRGEESRSRAPSIARAAVSAAVAALRGAP